MALKHFYTLEEIAAAIAEADRDGEARFHFPLRDDAVSFRFACYKRRRQHGIGRGFSFILREALSENQTVFFEILIRKTPRLELAKPLEPSEP